MTPPPIVSAALGILSFSLLLSACKEARTPLDQDTDTVAVAVVAVTPAADTVTVQGDILLRAEARDSAGAIVTGRTVYWASADTTLAVVSSAGIVKGIRIGTVQILATVEGVVGAASVRSIPVLNVAPDLPSLFSGDTVTLTAEFRDFLGGPIPGTMPVVSWQSLGAGASVSPSGVVQALATGTHLIEVAAGGARDTVELRVLAPRVGTNRELAYFATTSIPNRFAAVVKMYDPASAAVSNIVPDSENVFSFTWAPDGSRLAASLLQLNAVGRGGLFVFTPGAAPGTTPGGPALHHAWSPDGTRLVYANAATVGSVAINGTGRQVLVSNPEGMNGSAAAEPVWSPDGRRVAFRFQPNADFGGAVLYLARADGGGARRLTDSVRVTTFAWSPDGRFIAYLANGGGETGLWLVDTYSGSRRVLDALGARTTPRWTPEGRRLVYLQGAQIIVKDRDGAGRTPILDMQNIAGLDLSPDGQRLAFILQRQDTTPQFSYVMTIDTSGSGLVRHDSTRHLRGAPYPPTVLWRP